MFPQGSLPTLHRLSAISLRNISQRLDSPLILNHRIYSMLRNGYSKQHVPRLTPSLCPKRTHNSRLIGAYKRTLHTTSSNLEPDYEKPIEEQEWRNKSSLAYTIHSTHSPGTSTEYVSNSPENVELEPESDDAYVAEEWDCSAETDDTAENSALKRLLDESSRQKLQTLRRIREEELDKIGTVGLLGLKKEKLTRRFGELSETSERLETGSRINLAERFESIVNEAYDAEHSKGGRSLNAAADVSKGNSAKREIENWMVLSAQPYLLLEEFRFKRSPDATMDMHKARREYLEQVPNSKRGFKDRVPYEVLQIDSPLRSLYDIPHTKDKLEWQIPSPDSRRDLSDPTYLDKLEEFVETFTPERDLLVSPVGKEKHRGKVTLKRVSAVFASTERGPKRDFKLPNYDDLLDGNLHPPSGFIEFLWASTQVWGDTLIFEDLRHSRKFLMRGWNSLPLSIKEKYMKGSMTQYSIWQTEMRKLIKRLRGQSRKKLKTKKDRQQ